MGESRTDTAYGVGCRDFVLITSLAGSLAVHVAACDSHKEELAQHHLLRGTLSCWHCYTQHAKYLTPLCVLDEPGPASSQTSLQQSIQQA